MDSTEIVDMARDSRFGNIAESKDPGLDIE
jgi:hypothetical protein